MQAILFAIVAYFGWGSGDIFGTVASRKIGPYSATLWFLILQTVLLSFFSYPFLGNLKQYSLQMLLFNITLGIIATAGLVAFYEGLRIGSASLVGTISASFAAFVVVLSIIFFKEAISTNQAIAIIIVFVGFILASLDFDELKKRKVKVGREIILAIVAMITWSIYWTFIKVPIKEVGWFWPHYINTLSAIPVLFLYIYARKMGVTSLNHKGAFLPILLNAALLGAGSLAFNFSLQEGLAAVVAPIAGSYPTLFVALAFWFFKDKITKLQVGGIIITLIGIVALSFAS